MVFLPTEGIFLSLVETYLTENKNAQKLFTSGKPGIEWFEGLKKRWKHELDKRKAGTKSRALDLNQETTGISTKNY